MVDYLLRRERYDSLSLATNRGSLYWCSGGFHRPAVIAQVVGGIVCWALAAREVRREVA
jgi:cytosine/uracil/thiamine/allantoin permease